jgi:signal transduction histidine kinase
VVGLIHWGLFEVPGLDLDRIKIPIITVPGGTLPDQDNVSLLVDRLVENVIDLTNIIPTQIVERICKELEMMKFSPRAVLQSLDQGKSENDTGPSLVGTGHGTVFMVRPYDSVLDSDLSDEQEDETSQLEKYLIGFGNTIFPDFPQPPIKAAFRLHRSDGVVTDFIGERSFFNPGEYQTADQIIEGHFDEYGQFVGTVKIYDQPPVSYTLNWPGSQGGKSLCGPFDVRFGYVQGLQHQSLLPKIEWDSIDTKLRRFGGLYLYRDGVRILPYGNYDYDFLHVEKRRNLSARDWYFSFRRMFGAIMVSCAQNSALQEKAGREGFRENMAYRQFKDMLENLLKSLAIDFFRSNAPLGEEFNRKKVEFDQRKLLLEKREKQVKVKKEKFIRVLNDFFEQVEQGKPGAETEKVKTIFDSRFDSIAALDDPDEMGDQLHRLESDVRRMIGELRQRYRVSRPQGIGLTKHMTSDWNAYRKIYSELEEKQFAPLVAHFDGRLAELLEKRGVAINRRLLLREALESRQQTIKKNATRGEREAREGLTRARDSITKGITSSLNRLHNEIATVLSDFERTEVSGMSGEQIVTFRSTLERRLDGAAEREVRFLENLREQMDDLAEAISAGVLPDDVTSALEDNNREMQEEMEESLHWAQVGMALGIVQHEFNGVVRGIKKGIGQLQPWAKGTPALRELLNALGTGFSHLEEYLRLFAPLDRRLYRQKIELSGEEIRGYLLNVFGDRFKRHNIKFDATDSFRKHTLEVFPSTLLPVFINLLDNACYWLTTRTDSDRYVRIDNHPQGILVENNGPGIEKRLADRIFDFGFTMKNRGRGMGLSIARRALRHEGMDLCIIDPSKDNKARFLIKIAPEEKD